MKLRFVFIVAVLLCFGGCVSAKSKYVAPPKSVVPLPVARENVIAYHDSGQYYKDVHEKAESVAAAVDKAIADRVKYPAVVMVIEDVLLSTYPVRKRQGFSVNKEARRDLDSHVILSALSPVEPSVNLYEHLLSRNVPIFLVSYRSENLRIQIMENLTRVGFSGWNKIFMYPAKYPDDKNFCEEVRKGLEKTGFNIVATVGTLKEDVEGKSSGLKVLYPNYIYNER